MHAREAGKGPGGPDWWRGSHLLPLFSFPLHALGGTCCMHLLSSISFLVLGDNSAYIDRRWHSFLTWHDQLVIKQKAAWQLAASHPQPPHTMACMPACATPYMTCVPHTHPLPPPLLEERDGGGDRDRIRGPRSYLLCGSCCALPPPLLPVHCAPCLPNTVCIPHPPFPKPFCPYPTLITQPQFIGRHFWWRWTLAPLPTQPFPFPLALPSFLPPPCEFPQPCVPPCLTYLAFWYCCALPHT